MSFAVSEKSVNLDKAMVLLSSEEQVSLQGNVYGATHVSGYGTLVQGNINIYNASHGWPLRSTTSFLGMMPDPMQSLLTTNRTQTCINLPWLLASRTEKVTQVWANGRKILKETSRYLRIALFGRFMIYGGYSFDRSGGLYIYPVRYRHVVCETSPIMLACRNGCYGLTRQILLDGAGSVDDVTKGDLTPLFFAIDGGHIDIVHLLLSFGADPNQTFGENQTSPLAWALYRRSHEMIRTLIQAQADLHHISRKGWSILHALWISEDDLQPSCVDLLQILQAHDADLLDMSGQPTIDEDGWSLFSRVAGCGTPDELAFFISNGVDVAWKNEYDWDAVFEAVSGGKLDNLELLSTYLPSSLTRRDSLGWTTLHYAAENPNEDVIRFLLQHGLDWQAPVIGSLCSETPSNLTPAKVARGIGVELEVRFLELVREIDSKA